MAHRIGFHIERIGEQFALHTEVEGVADKAGDEHSDPESGTLHDFSWVYCWVVGEIAGRPADLFSRRRGA
jgi:hypothetical protein